VKLKFKAPLEDVLPHVAAQAGWLDHAARHGGALGAPATAFQYDRNKLPIGQQLWLEHLLTYEKFPPRGDLSISVASRTRLLTVMKYQCMRCSVDGGILTGD
jgi:hypothetical protein